MNSQNDAPSKTNRMAELQDLLRRVEAATGPDRELDEALCAAFGTFIPFGARFSPNNFRSGARSERYDVTRSAGVISSGDRYVEPYTSCVDAALALAERVLPGKWIELTGPRKYLNIPSPVPNFWRAECGSIGWGATPALALCAALLRAVLAQAPQEATLDGASPQITPTDSTRGNDHG